MAENADDVIAQAATELENDAANLDAAAMGAGMSQRKKAVDINEIGEN